MVQSTWYIAEYFLTANAMQDQALHDWKIEAMMKLYIFLSTFVASLKISKIPNSIFLKI